MKRKADLRRLAKHKECQVRIPGHCNHNFETVVLAHIRRGGVAGVGQKPPDLCGVWACSGCHDVIDGRVPSPIHELDGHILEAMCRTLAEIDKEHKVVKK